MDAAGLTPLVLDYPSRQAAAPKPLGQAVVMLTMGGVAACLSLAILAVTMTAWVETWPSFGVTLLVVPAGVVAAAFAVVAATALRVAVGDLQD